MKSETKGFGPGDRTDGGRKHGQPKKKINTVKSQRRPGSKVDRKRAVDPVDLVARRISYSLQADLFCALGHDFEVHEPGQQRQTATPDSQDISVEFDAELSQEVVIEALESIVAEIKLNGLPEVRKQMDRRLAALVMDLQAEGAELSRELAALPIGLRAELEHIFKSRLKPGIRVRLNKRRSST